MDIKSECEMLYSQIKQAETRLKELRTICLHQTTFEGNYSLYRTNSYQPAEICSDCGELIQYL